MLSILREKSNIFFNEPLHERKRTKKERNRIIWESSVALHSNLLVGMEDVFLFGDIPTIAFLDYPSVFSLLICSQRLTFYAIFPSLNLPFAWQIVALVCFLSHFAMIMIMTRVHRINLRPLSPAYQDRRSHVEILDISTLLNAIYCLSVYIQQFPRDQLSRPLARDPSVTWSRSVLSHPLSQTTCASNWKFAVPMLADPASCSTHLHNAMSCYPIKNTAPSTPIVSIREWTVNDRFHKTRASVPYWFRCWFRYLCTWCWNWLLARRHP